MYILFTYYAYTVHVLKNIKNETHDTIYTFKYYFATVFSVFSFQFLVYYMFRRENFKCLFKNLQVDVKNRKKKII